MEEKRKSRKLKEEDRRWQKKGQKTRRDERGG